MSSLTMIVTSPTILQEEITTSVEIQLLTGNGTSKNEESKNMQEDDIIMLTPENFVPSSDNNDPLWLPERDVRDVRVTVFDTDGLALEVQNDTNIENDGENIIINEMNEANVRSNAISNFRKPKTRKRKFNKNDTRKSRSERSYKRNRGLSYLTKTGKEIGR